MNIINKIDEALNESNKPSAAKGKNIIITYTTQKGGQHQQAIFDGDTETKDAEHFISAVPDWGKVISVKHKKK